MRNAQNGSLLLDALIALSITCFLVVCISHITGDVSRALKSITKTSQHHLKIIAVANQLERDLSSIVVIPTKQAAEDKDEEKQGNEPKKRKISRALIGHSDANDAVKIGKKEFHTFKTLNGLTTSPLESYGENKPHMVRFTYKLIKQTLKAPQHKTRAFKLYRKETTDLDDLNLKQETETREAQFAASSEWILLCDNISDFFVQYQTYTQPSTQPGQDGQTASTSTEKTPQPSPMVAGTSEKKKAPLEQVHAFTWPIAKLGKDYKQRVPHSINIILRLWNEDYTKTLDYQQIVPCMAYAGTLPEHLIESSANKKQAPESAALKGTKTDVPIITGSQQPGAPLGTGTTPPPQPPLLAPLPVVEKQVPSGMPMLYNPPSHQAQQPNQISLPSPQMRPAPRHANPFLNNMPQGTSPEVEKFMTEYQDKFQTMTLPEIIKAAPPELAQEIALETEKMAQDPEKYYREAMEMLKHAF